MATWNLDSAHSEIEFKVRHMMISTVKGSFESFKVNLTSETEDISKAKIEVSVDVTSISTKSEQRDQHLKSEEFFNTSEYPEIVFNSTAVNSLGDQEYEIIGDLTIKDTTKSVTFKAEFGGIAKDPWGNAKVGYTVTGKINRNDFGLTWNAALETGGVMVSEEVKFSADIQLIKG